MTTPKLPAILLTMYFVVFSVAGISPHNHPDWWLENVIPLAAISLLVITYRKFRFSNLAYTAAFLFLVFHTLGAHYTYSEVPLGHMAAEQFGWERNHYDRWLHFLYGFLIAPMAVELFDTKAPARGIWALLLPTLFLASHSMIYEIIEWWVAATLGGELGAAYLGTQGDVWDAQKDMALGLLGAASGVAAVRLTRKPQDLNRD
ncbi:DUF2238 domain-containing protein [Thioalkalivibrio sulfidiphilus]|uniref:DUF2238 domain-containing protein n=1 Tax=Thioalkalivibrio sulfidiphilus TaxID=1033854 RepID=UPI003BB08B1F